MDGVIRIPNIQSYTQEIINGELIITPKIQYITETELAHTSLTSSKLIECVIQNNDDIISNKTKYRSLLIDIWKTMPTQKIIKNTNFNCRLGNEKGEKGYNYNDDLKMSIQGKDSNHTMKEIISMVRLNNYKIYMSIKLDSGQIIYFKVE